MLALYGGIEFPMEVFSMQCPKPGEKALQGEVDTVELPTPSSRSEFDSTEIKCEVDRVASCTELQDKIGRDDSHTRAQSK